METPPPAEDADREPGWATRTSPPEGRLRVGARLRLVLVTGLSGAGKTETSRALEDIGFYVVDNLPPALIPTFAELCGQSAQVRRAALVVDVRGREFFDTLASALAALDARGVPYEILFLEAEEAALVRRYKESRRQHPLAPGGGVVQAIREERERLAPLRARADRVLDTSGLRPAELRARLASLYAPPGSPRLAVQVVSFGFKHGLPPDADLVLDVRFLPNPFYVPALRSRDGRDQAVAEYVLRAPVTARFLDLAGGLLDFLLPQYVAEGKAQLIVAIGCTGGRHRSVVIAEALAERLRRPGLVVQTLHRDAGLEGGSRPEAGGASAPDRRPAAGVGGCRGTGGEGGPAGDGPVGGDAAGGDPVDDGPVDRDPVDDGPVGG